MKKFIFKLFCIGLLIFVFISAAVMCAALINYFVLLSIGFLIDRVYFTYASWAAFAIGLLAAFFWYGWLLLLIRKYIGQILNRYFKKEKE